MADGNETTSQLRLDDREQATLRALAEGRTKKEMAEQDSISTVEAQISALAARLGVDNRRRLILAEAVRAGLLEPPEVDLGSLDELERRAFRRIGEGADPKAPGPMRMADPEAVVDRLQRKLAVTRLRLIALATMAEARGSEARGSEARSGERLNWVTPREARVLRLLKDRESPGAIAKCLAMDGKEVNEIIAKVSKSLGIAKGDLPQWLRDSRDW